MSSSAAGNGLNQTGRIERHTLTCVLYDQDGCRCRNFITKSSVSRTSVSRLYFVIRSCDLVINRFQIDNVHLHTLWVVNFECVVSKTLSSLCTNEPPLGGIGRHDTTQLCARCKLAAVVALIWDTRLVADDVCANPSSRRLFVR